MDKRNKNEEEEQEDEVIETWNKKRLFIASVIVIPLLFLAAYYAIGSFKNKFLNHGVLGSQTSATSSKVDIQVPSSHDVEKTIEDAKENIAKMTSDNVTSSQAAIGKIIYDLQELQKGNKDAKEYLCEVVCKK